MPGDEKGPVTDLEIGLHRWDAHRYAVDLRFRRSDSEADQAPVRGYAMIDLEALGEEGAGYGAALGAALFGDNSLKEEFLKARAVAQAIDAPLRVRVFVGPSAPELHSVSWELLNDPGLGYPLPGDPKVYFSRFLSGIDYSPVRLRSRGHLRSLIAVANPSDLPAYKPGGGVPGAGRRGGRDLARADVSRPGGPRD
jgi:hypothetical protein